MTVVGVQRHRAEVHGQQDDVLVEDEEIEDCAAPLASQNDRAAQTPYGQCSVASHHAWIRRAPLERLQQVDGQAIEHKLDDRHEGRWYWM